MMTLLMIGGKFKKWEESSARVIKCDGASVHKRDEFMGHETMPDFINPLRQNSTLDGQSKGGCESCYPTLSLSFVY